MDKAVFEKWKAAQPKIREAVEEKKKSLFSEAYQEFSMCVEEGLQKNVWNLLSRYSFVQRHNLPGCPGFVYGPLMVQGADGLEPYLKDGREPYPVLCRKCLLICAPSGDRYEIPYSATEECFTSTCLQAAGSLQEAGHLAEKIRMLGPDMAKAEHIFYDGLSMFCRPAEGQDWALALDIYAREYAKKQSAAVEQEAAAQEKAMEREKEGLFSAYSRFTMDLQERVDSLKEILQSVEESGLEDDILDAQAGGARAILHTLPECLEIKSGGALERCVAAAFEDEKFRLDYGAPARGGCGATMRAVIFPMQADSPEELMEKMQVIRGALDGPQDLAVLAEQLDAAGRALSNAEENLEEAMEGIMGQYLDSPEGEQEPEIG